MKFNYEIIKQHGKFHSIIRFPYYETIGDTSKQYYASMKVIKWVLNNWKELRRQAIEMLNEEWESMPDAPFLKPEYFQTVGQFAPGYN